MLGFSLALSQPGGGFAAPVAMSVGMYVSNVCAADLNRDGRMDLVLVGGLGAAVVLGNGNGTFSGPQFLSMPLTPGAGGNCAATDLNGDGNLDVLVPGSGGLAVSLGNGDGTFRPAVLYATPLASFYVLTADFNNDGKTDALVNVNSVSSANMFLGRGDGTFLPPFAILAVPFGAQAGDFNNDGKIDLVMQTAQARQDGSNFSIAIALGQGTGNFLQYSNYVFAQPFSGHVVADFNRDGRLDVATYLTGKGTVTVFSGRGDGSLGPVLFEQQLGGGPFALMGADVDSNGAADLVVSAYPQYTVFRNTAGNPPLMAQLAVSPAAVIGGAVDSTGTVTLGGPAPAGGILVTLESGDPRVVLSGGPSVMIPAGASSATFLIRTVAVAAPVAATITARAGGVTQTARLDVVPGFALADFAISPASQYGIFTSTGTVTLNGPAATATLVSLSSGNPAVAQVPATVLVPAGAVSASFPIVLQNVAVNTAVGISASYEGVVKNAVVTVLRAADTVSVSKLLYTAKSFDLRVDATGSNAAAVITVYNAANGAVIGSLRNSGGGKYGGSFVVNLGQTPRIVLKSSLGGAVTVAVTVK
jgi:hypothetical protein